MEPAHEIPSLELLLAQEGWVRALARKLVGRGREAEDVAQSALVAALEHPPRSGENAPVLRAWLAQVARRLAIGSQRAESRRLERERQVARSEALPSASEIHAQEEERRIVVEALLALNEPFRTTLLLRYYRGLEPMAIARATGVPDSTVRNRLARGLEHLKHKLEARSGADWRAGCMLLAGKGVLMGVNLKVAITCSAVALAGLAWWGLRGSAAEGPKSAQLEVASAHELSSEADKPADDAPSAPAMRAKVEQDPSSPNATVSAANDPVGILVYGAVRQKDGAPTRGGAWVRLLSPEGREHSKPVDSQGAFAFTGLDAGQWKLTASLTGYREQTVDLQLDAAHPIRRIDLALEARTQIPVRFVTPDGRRLKDALRDLRPAGMMLEFDLGVVASERELPPAIPGRTLARYPSSTLGAYYPSDGDSFIGFQAATQTVDGLLVVEDRFPMFVSATWRNAVLQTRPCATAPEELVFTIEPEQVLERIGGFRVRLVDAIDQTPLKPNFLHLSMRSYGATLGPGPIEDGVLECAQLAPGTLEVSLSCAGHERFTEILDIQAGVVLDLGTRELGRSTACDVEVVDPDGKPLANVTFSQLDASALTAARPPDPAGMFPSDSAGLLRCRCGPTETWIVPHDDEWTAEPVLLVGSSRPRLVMQRGSELVATIAASVPDDALFLVRDRNRRCLVIEQARPGFLVRSRLLPGHYEVELVNFGGTILATSIELGEKTLVVDLAP